MNLLQRIWGSRTDRAVIGPSATVVGPARAEVITPPPRLAWDEKRWQKVPDAKAAAYTGHFQVFDYAANTWRSFPGRIIDERGEIKAFIADPPAQVKYHPHGRCFQLVRAPWFLLHWQRRPETVDAALLYVEQVLHESINSSPRRAR